MTTSPPWKFRQFAADHPGKAVAEAVAAVSQLELGIGDTLVVLVLHPPAPLAPRAGNDQPSALDDPEGAADRAFGGHIQRRRYEDGAR